MENSLESKISQNVFSIPAVKGIEFGSGFALYALGWIGYEGTAAVQGDVTIFGLKVICVLIPAIFVLGSWAAFKFVWNITPEVRAQMAERKAAAVAVANDAENG